MGKVHYKFTYNDTIDFPGKITFGGQAADLIKDKQEGYLIEGDVDDVFLRVTDKKLNVYVESTGRAFQTWELEVTFEGKETETFPIKGTLDANGNFTLNKNYKIKS